MIVAYRFKHRAVFILGFAKSEQENLEPSQLLVARKLAAKWLGANSEQLAQAIEERELQEVNND